MLGFRQHPISTGRTLSAVHIAGLRAPIEHGRRPDTLSPSPKANLIPTMRRDVPQTSSLSTVPPLPHEASRLKFES